MTVVAMRVDATRERGFGNLCRSITFAEALAETGHRPVFVCRDGGLAPEYLASQGHREVVTFGADEGEFDAILTSGPGLVVADVGSTSHASLAALKEAGVLIVTFDDLGDGRYLADIVVDANLTAATNPRKIQTPTRYLLGPRFQVFSSATYAARRKRRRIGPLRRVIVSCGGTDPGNVTSRIVRGLASLDTEIDVEVVLGPGFVPTKELNAEIVDAPREFDIAENPPDFAARLRAADVGILSGGLTMFEAAYLGLPSIIISQNETQARNVPPLRELGIVVDLGAAPRRSDSDSADGPFAALMGEMRLLENESVRKVMSEAGPRYVDGKGVKRLIQEIKRLIGS